MGKFTDAVVAASQRSNPQFKFPFFREEAVAAISAVPVTTRVRVVENPLQRKNAAVLTLFVLAGCGLAFALIQGARR
jgi:hypothetical protein